MICNLCFGLGDSSFSWLLLLYTKHENENGAI